MALVSGFWSVRSTCGAMRRCAWWIDYDVVVGGGMAGLSAGTMLGRSRRKVVVVDAGEPRNARSEHLHGFFSRAGMEPAELLATGRPQRHDFHNHHNNLRARTEALGQVCAVSWAHERTVVHQPIR